MQCRSVSCDGHVTVVLVCELCSLELMNEGFASIICQIVSNQVIVHEMQTCVERRGKGGGGGWEGRGTGGEAGIA